MFSKITSEEQRPSLCLAVRSADEYAFTVYIYMCIYNSRIKGKGGKEWRKGGRKEERKTHRARKRRGRRFHVVPPDPGATKGIKILKPPMKMALVVRTDRLNTIYTHTHTEQTS